MTPGQSAASTPFRQSLSRLFQRSELGLLLAIIVVLVLTTLFDSQHIYWNNPRPSAVDILRQTAMLGIFAIGAAIVIIAGGIDLSSGSMIAFSGTICASLMLLLAPDAVGRNQPLSVWIIGLACLGTILSGFLVGSLHAWLITVIDLPPFVATLATLVGLRSLSRALVSFVNKGSTQIPIPNVEFRYLATSVWIPALICLVLIVTAWVVMSRTVVGRHLYALGGNESAARLSGIRTDQLKWLAYCISAVLSSIAGILLVAEVAVTEPETLGKGYELNAIAAAVVGGCSLQGGVGTITGTILGALFLRVVMDGVAKIIKSSADVYEGLIVGSVVVLAVAFTQLRQAGRRGKRFFAGALGIVSIVNLALAAGVLAMLFGQKSELGGWTLGGIVSLTALAILFLTRLFEGRQRTAYKG